MDDLEDARMARSSRRDREFETDKAQFGLYIINTRLPLQDGTVTRLCVETQAAGRLYFHTGPEGLGDLSAYQQHRVGVGLSLSLPSSNPCCGPRWVREFLNEENRGLDILIEYLSFRLMVMRGAQQLREEQHGAEQQQQQQLPQESISNGRPPLVDLDSMRMKRANKHIARLNMGEAKDDIHVCIMCLRAIMNNKVLLHFVLV
ncbi:FMNL2, partial [Cordylochernes scorpioides]